MNMDKRSILAVVFCLIFYLVYTQYLNKKYPNYNKRDSGSTEVNQSSSTDAATKPIDAVGSEGTGSTANQPAAISATPIERLPESDLKFDTKDVVYTFDQDYSALANVQLKHYRPAGGTPGEWLQLLEGPLTIFGTDQVANAVKEDRPGYLAHRTAQGITFSRQQGDWLIRQEFVVPQQGYNLEISVSYENTSKDPKELMAAVVMRDHELLPRKSGGFLGFGGGSRQQNSFIYGVDGGRTSEDIRKFCEDEEKQSLEKFHRSGEKFDFFGVDKHYFLTVFQPQVKKIDLDLIKVRPTIERSCLVAFLAAQNFGFVKPGEKVALNFNAFMGPKDVDILKAQHDNLTKTVDFGYFAVIAYPLLVAIKAVGKYVGNYGVAIIIITTILKLLFYPLTKAAAVSTKRYQKLMPQMNEIKERYKSDTQKQQREMMAFMSKNKVNPAKGCLPVLPQIPVFIAFYNVLSQSIELRQAPFFGWIKDLSLMDPYLITPILLGVGMFIQSKLTPTPGMDKMQARMMTMMPVIFSVMMLSMPAGMVVYMLTNTAISIGQQRWLNRRLAKMDLAVSES